jgi:hypothetical protein
MASSWAPDLREHIQQKRILSFVNHSVNFMRSYVPIAHNSSSKVADVESYIAEVQEETFFFQTQISQKTIKLCRVNLSCHSSPSQNTCGTW